jgi:hypothetical protein
MASEELAHSVAGNQPVTAIVGKLRETARGTFTTSLVNAVRVSSGTIGLSWLTSAAAVAYAQKRLRTTKYQPRKETHRPRTAVDEEAGNPG